MLLDFTRLYVLRVCVVGVVDRVLCPSCSSNAVCAHSVAVKVWDVEILTCQQGIREKDVCEWWRLLQCAAWSRFVRRRMANHWGQIVFCRPINFQSPESIYVWWFGQESLSIFQRLAEISKLLEGENYVLSSTYWGALFDVEEVIAPHATDSAPIAALRQAMHDDHFNKRVTLEQSLSNVLHVLMTLLDPRSMLSFSFFICYDSICFCCLAFRWRVHRTVKLTADQWNIVKALFLQYVPQFFPNNCMLPVFVPLNGNVLTKLEELQQEIEELKQPAPPAASAAVPPLLPYAAPARDEYNHPHPDMQDKSSRRRKEDMSRTVSLLLHQQLLPLHMLLTWMVPCRWKRRKKSRKSGMCNGNWHTGSVLLLLSCHGTPHSHNPTFNGRRWSRNSHASLSSLVGFSPSLLLLLLRNACGPALVVWLASSRAQSIPPSLHKSCFCATTNTCWRVSILSILTHDFFIHDAILDETNWMLIGRKLHRLDEWINHKQTYIRLRHNDSIVFSDTNIMIYYSEFTSVPIVSIYQSNQFWYVLLSYSTVPTMLKPQTEEMTMSQERSWEAQYNLRYRTFVYTFIFLWSVGIASNNSSLRLLERYPFLAG